MFLGKCAQSKGEGGTFWDAKEPGHFWYAFVVLVPECLFVFENVVFVFEICVLVVKDRSVSVIYSFTFGTSSNSGILRPGSTKCRLCLRKSFLSQKAVCISRFRWPLCATNSRALRAEYCIVGTPHNTAVYSLDETV